MHALFLARLLGIPRVIVPKNPGLLSAQGMLMADVIRDYSQTVMVTAPVSPEWAEELFQPLEDRALEEVHAEGIPLENIRLQRFLDMRYKGQSYELIVPFQPHLERAFHEQHQKRYGYRNPNKPVEIVNVRLRASGEPEKPILLPSAVPPSPSLEEAVVAVRPVNFSGRFEQTPLYKRESLHPGQQFKGPAIIVEYSSTLVIPPGWDAEVDAWENVLFSLEGKEEGECKR